MNLSIRIFLSFLLLSVSIQAASIEIVTKFSKTGGIYGDLNTVGDIVNGREICPSANNNSNDVPGCDMSQDSGYNNNGTDNNVTDDYYTGDLIVRTNDIFQIKVGWNATGVNNPITLSSTLPSFGGKNYLRWEKLPSSCKEGSFISDDGLSLVCVRTDDASISYSEDTRFKVKVKANTPNNTKTGEISFSISSDGLETKTDSTDGYELTVTAKPMWNIQKKHVATFEGQVNSNGDEGYIVRYAYILEADEVQGETETSSAVLGNEALGKDFSLSFIDDVSQISPNAEYIACSVTGAEGSYEPYPWYHADAPKRSVGSLESDLSVTCSQSTIGGDISVEYRGIDASLEHVPTRYADGGIIPLTRLPIASGTVDIFVPLDDIKSATAIGNDSYQLDTNNTITSFDPLSISGQSNFEGLSESIKDNSVSVPLIYRGPGYTGGTYHKYFSNSVDTLAPLPDTTNGFYSADGIVTPDKEFASWVYVANSGNKDFNNTILCDVIDSNLYDVIDIEQDVTAVKLYGNTVDLNYSIEYGTGYINSWPPPLNQDNSQNVINECKDSTITWYSTTKEARDNGEKITKVRLQVPTGIPAGYSAGFITKLKVRSEDLSGNIIPSGTNLVNYSALHDSVLFSSLANNWDGATRVLNSYPTSVSGGDYRADRAIMTRAKVRILKELSTTIAEPSDEVTVKIASTFTTESQTPESSDVKVTEILAPGLKYVVGSANIGDPTIGSCDDIEDTDSLKTICTADYQVLVWDLGVREANSALEDIEYKFLISAFTQSGESSTYSVISSPTDTSNPDIRKANKNISVTIPSSLFITKEVNTPYRDINQSPIEYTSYARNGSSEDLTNIDIIDILPFNGDGREGFNFSVASTVVAKKRDLPTSFNGTLAFLQASGDYACLAGVTWRYTNRTPSELDIAPTHVSNKVGGDTTWCEGTDTGPDASCGYDNSEVTAVRLSGPDLPADATCSFNVKLTPLNNKKGDVYTNTASAFAQGVTLPTLSNDVSAFVPTTLLGDYVWMDTNANGIQDDDEVGISGITIELLDVTDSTLRNVASDKNGKYIFDDLLADTEYKVKAVIPSYYAFTSKSSGINDKKDSDVDPVTGTTDLKVLNANQQYRHLDIGLTSTLTISGQVYKQEDGSVMENTVVKLYRDENKDGTLDSNDTFMTSIDILSNSEYEFTNIFDGEYIVEINEESGFSNDYKLLSNQILDVNISGNSVVDQDFIYGEKPKVFNIVHETILNIVDSVTLEDLNATDNNGTVESFIITSIPDALSGTLYLSDGVTEVQVGDELTPSQAQGLKFKPASGFIGEASFTYKAKDNDGLESYLDATVKIPIRGLHISGSIYNDGNRNGIVDGVGISILDGVQLFVSLLDMNDTLIDSKSINTDGSYLFEKDIFADNNYTVILTTVENNVSSYLPRNWNNADGEHIGTDAGLDDVADGTIAVSVAREDVPEVNFGINKKPEASDVTKAVEFNPGGIVQVAVLDLNVSDKEDGTPTTVTIKTLPNNGTLYYNGTAVIAGQVILNFNNTQLTVDPDSGEQTVEFTYTTTDKVGVESDPATAIMPFKDLKISGYLFIDGNGDDNVNGTATSTADGVQLYATLVKDGTAIASMPLGGGAYMFDIEDGVKANSNFTVVLSETNGSTTASLPADWDNNDGENINSISSTGNDGSKDGVLAVNVVEADVTLADFGINKKPEAHDVTEPEQVNPGTDSDIPVPDLNISDSQSNNLDVNFTSVPDNGTLYYNGAIVHAGEVIENFNNSLLTIDPEAGDQSVSFDYSVRDEAGVVSDTATVSMSFKNIIISGKLFNDGNGNGNVDGNATAKADDRQLYVTLVDSTTGTPLSSKALDSNGTYYFDSVDGLSPDTNYTVVLTDTENSVNATLPSNWNNADGENIGLIGLDGTADGIVAVSVLRVDISEINFGINRQPEAEDRTEASQVNPGSTTQVAVPDLNITDREDGNPTILTVTVLPTNGTLYYKGNPVVAGDAILNVETDKFTFDPNDGDLTAVFKYTTTDIVGVASEPATVTLPFTALQISGNIFNDGDNNGKVDGTGISAPSGTQLYVTLLDANGTALASKEVSGDGSYMFGNTDGIVADSNYSVVLTTTLNDINASLPEGWSNLDGEHIGVDAGTDGSNDGFIAVPVATQNVVEVNFGINKKPVAGDHTEPLQLNPGGNVRVNVPDLLISDNEDGNLTTVTIETVPSHGTLYYDGVEVVAGQVIHDLNNSLLTLDPENGDQTVSFTYSTVDGVGDKSDIATMSMLFDGLEIRGNIFDDGNHDGSVNGTKISKIGSEQLYVTLLNINGNVMATKAVTRDGSYLFDGVDGIVPNSGYGVVLSSEANATTSTLPTDWNHEDGEEIAMRGGAGLDAIADGKIVVDVVESDIIEVNLGVNERPTATDKTENLRLNPGANNQVSVPTLEVTDREDINPTTVIVTTLPTNGVLYYNGVEVVEDANISNVDVSKFTIDPDHGDLNVTFEYVSVDATGWHSKPATVAMPFNGLKISGKVFLDTNGDNIVDGMPFSSDSYGLQVYANLVDGNGDVVKTVAVNSSGEYLFDVTTGIVPNSDYKVVLSSEQNTTVATIPSNWEHTDHNTNGVIDVHVAISDVENINFGLNKQPVVHDIVGHEIVNPDGNRTVDVPNLEIDTNEDGNTTASTVTLTNLPTNGTLYYNGVKVTEGQRIENFNNSLLVVDPADYNLTVEFTYTVEDGAGFESEPATVAMPFSDSDTDGDGITNSQDLDDDNDGILDTDESNTSLNGGDTDGDGLPDRIDLDSDGDGILDLVESETNSTRVVTIDSNGDGMVDSNVDNDHDGIMDSADADDNSSTAGAIVTPVDTDNDGQPDFQDIDSDNDGLSDVVEGGTDANQDSNSDGVLDDLTDSDGDGVVDVVDVDNNGTVATTPDTDRDGQENYRDLDSDGDALLDVDEINGTDTNGDGYIDPVGTLVDGMNLPDENNNSIPDVLEMKLKDDIKTAPAGTVATIDLLENDVGDINPDSIKLIIPTDFNGTARLSPDGKTMLVDGEGEWSVDNNGTLTFKPEVGFQKSPTPIKYKASNLDGSKTAIATIVLKVTAVAGISADDAACPDYIDNSASVPTFGIYGLILMVLFGSIFGASLMRRE